MSKPYRPTDAHLRALRRLDAPSPRAVNSDGTPQQVALVTYGWAGGDLVYSDRTWSRVFNNTIRALLAEELVERQPSTYFRNRYVITDKGRVVARMYPNRLKYEQ